MMTSVFHVSVCDFVLKISLVAALILVIIYSAQTGSSSLIVGTEVESHPPCSFNPLCLCSNPGPMDLGIVSCHGIDLGRVPLNSSRAFVLSLTRNQLRVLQNKQLVGAGLWRLEIRHNRLASLEDESLIGLEKSLWELDLQNNELTSVPTNAIKDLQKLKSLDLSGNQISDVDSSNFQCFFEATLSWLNVAGNLLVHVPEEAFVYLSNLEYLDLSDNSLKSVGNSAFPQSIVTLLLSGNLLRSIPFQSLQGLDLELLDLSRNLIRLTHGEATIDGRIKIKELRLDGNQIMTLETWTFEQIEDLSSLSLRYNPIESIGPNFLQNFESLKNLDVSHCFISSIDITAFQRLLPFPLLRLNLGYNNVSTVPLGDFVELNFDQNENVDETTLFEQINGQSLQTLSAIGKTVHLASIPELKNLRSFNGNVHLPRDTVDSDVFRKLPPTLVELRLSRSRIVSIKNNTFQYTPNLKVIDLSYNRIHLIGSAVFSIVGHSLLKLNLNSALRMSSLPSLIFEKLTHLQELDLSGNRLESLPHDSFLKNKQLKFLNLRFNKLSQIDSRLFRSLQRLQRLFLSFNPLTAIKSKTFNRLNNLERLELNENLLESLEAEAFSDLTNVQVLNLAGNWLETLQDDTFQNLPKLRLLDLSYNRLIGFNPNAFDQIGTLSHLKVDVSHNNISALTLTSTDSKNSGGHDNIPTMEIFMSSASIESTDFSCNNISEIGDNFFSSFGKMLLDVDLSKNSLNHLSKSHFTGLEFIQRLNLGQNLLQNVDYDTFEQLGKLQVLFLENNRLRDIPPDLFEHSLNLRILSLRGNRIRNLADSVFKNTKLEHLDIGGNLLLRFPEVQLRSVSTTLARLDISNNNISSVASIKLNKLKWLSLSNNRISAIGHETFDFLEQLQYLDLSANQLHRIDVRWFQNLRSHLLHLNISNLGLTNLPNFESFGKLLTFNISDNFIENLPKNFGINMSTLRTLDISNNEMTAAPNSAIWQSIPRLWQISIKGNPIIVLSNDSFAQLETLQRLDISELPLEILEIGSLSPFVTLKELIMGPLMTSSKVVSPAALVQNLQSLQSLHLKMDVSSLTEELRMHPLPPKLDTITLSGLDLVKISPGALEGVSNRWMTLRIKDTGLEELPTKIASHLTSFSVQSDGTNPVLTKIENPNPGFVSKPLHTFLTNIESSSELQLRCTCDESGWIELWLHEWMNTNCIQGSRTESERCNSMLTLMRSVTCVSDGSPRKSFSEAILTDLKCAWENSATELSTMSHFFFSSFVLMMNFG